MLMKRYRPSSYVVRKGTLLYTGTGSRANRKAVRAGGGKTELLYLSPNKEVAEAYRFVVTAEVTKDLMLAHKADVMSLVHKEKKQRGTEWAGFGGSEADNRWATLLCKLGGYDGWVHKPKSQYFSEVMLCKVDSVRFLPGAA